MNTKRNSRRTASALCLVAFAAVIGGCSEAEILRPDAEIVNRASQALALDSVNSINGTYGVTCLERVGAWSVAVEGGATLDHTALSVIKNDADCVLTLTEIIADDITYESVPTIGLDDTYEVAASEFAVDGTGPVIFYANAKINPDDFSADFTVTVLYSDDPNAASGSNNASFAQWASSAVGDHLAAPNYTVTDNIAVQTDAEDVVTLALGSVDLTDGLVTGEHYFVDLGTLPATPTYAQVDAVFAAATPTAIVGADPEVDVADFALDAETLPIVRTLIIRHVENDVPAYQTFKVTFNAP